MNARFMRIGFMMLNGVKEKRHMTHLLVDLICFISRSIKQYLILKY